MTAAWDELASAALLGTDRGGAQAVAALLGVVPGPAGEVAARLDPADAPRALLDAACLLAAQRSAGALVPPSVAAPAPAPRESRPVVSAAASRLLRTLFAGTDASLAAGLVLEWLHLAATSGRVIAPADLVAVLERCAASTAVADAALPVLGERGAWLAALHPVWATSIRRAALRAAGQGPADQPLGATAVTALEEQWRFGDPSQRRLALARLRRHDPAHARGLLEAGWDAEDPAERPALLGLLAAGLGAEDEPLLERALDDRRKGVRAAAAQLLARLPDSGLATRMAGRAQACVRLERHLLRRRIVVVPPADRDAATARDGIEEKPKDPGMGPRAWWVQQIVAATPLRTWSAAWGLSPAEIVAAPVDEWAQLLHLAWAQAVAADPGAPDAVAWAQALVAVTGGAVRGLLLPVLPAADRERAAAHLLATASLTRGTHGSQRVESQVTEALEACPGPWGPELTAAVLQRLARDGDARTWADHARVPLLALRLPPAVLPDVVRLLDGHPPGTPWYVPLTRLRDVLALRHQLHEELR